MCHVFLDMTLSLDGFVAGRNVAAGNPLGDNGARLHNWLFGDGSRTPTDVDRQISAEMFEGTGAFIFGRRTFDVGIDTWGEDGTFGLPCYVLTNRARPVLVKGPTTFNFITTGARNALIQAMAAAGNKAVCVMGGAEVARQFLRAGLLAELRIHVVPVLLGRGARLFAANGSAPVDLEPTRVIETPFATHMKFRVVQ